MDFSYREEQLEVQSLAVQIIADYTTADHQKRLDAQDQRFDADLWQALASAGLLGVALEETSGGMGFDFESLCLLVEEVGRHVAAVPVIPALVSAALPLQRYGVEHHKALLSQLANGTYLPTVALLEPGNEDALRPGMSATEVDGGWRLSGAKHCVPFLEQSDSVLLAADSEKGLLVFLLPTEQIGTQERQHSTAHEPQSIFELSEVLVDSACLVAAGDEALEMMQWCVQLTRAAISAMALGVCERMLKMTAEYTSQREQFGVPIATFQAVGHRAADAFIDIECLRLAAQQAVSRLSLNLDAEEATIIAKIWASDVCHRVSQSAQHLHGGIGVDRDYPLFRYCLWARQLELSQGSAAQLTEILGQDIAMGFSATEA